MFTFFRTVYTPVDQTEFKKYGFTIAMLRQLQNDVINVKKLIWFKIISIILFMLIGN